MKLFAILILSLILTTGANAQMRRSIPEELIGKWSAGAGSAMRDAGQNEVSRSAGGERTSIEFNADGTFVFATRLSVQFDGCEASLFNYNPGKFIVTGSVVNFDPDDDELIYTNGCHPNLNSSRHSPPIKASFSYALENIDGIETLCLSDGRDLKKCYSKVGRS